MSDESSQPEPADRPVRTIWDQYESIRGWIGIVFLMPVLLCAIPLLGALMGLAQHGITSLPEILFDSFVIYPLLLGSLSVVSFGLSQGKFGTGTKALTMAYGMGFLWLVLGVVVIGILFRSVRSLSELMSLWNTAALFASCIPFGSIFFITYLLRRTNQVR